MADPQPTFGPQEEAPRGIAALELALRRRSRWVATTACALAHLAIVIAIFSARPEAMPPEPAP